MIDDFFAAFPFQFPLHLPSIKVEHMPFWKVPKHGAGSMEEIEAPEAFTSGNTWSPSICHQ